MDNNLMIDDDIDIDYPLNELVRFKKNDQGYIIIQNDQGMSKL